jgi:hypothetical protein
MLELALTVTYDRKLVTSRVNRKKYRREREERKKSGKSEEKMWETKTTRK